ncbi:hypothetical protein MPTK1_1g06740 [Marchantia polymorpha subsp. ruderalis]|uniref:TraB domain-containing protein n=2 Tax=Marchantia polymorpha TaxID=3197 RepID=A0AAF6AMA8_MARPO|nr:hypothetical protein MARPO_0043s0066 [Marchantia polymorpha]BBM97578.1 hypothetical protein Mp_1g06740 [Marchantia polymorpha subsp. ruderalis]|eukprot:PTQ39819.1 hypothetical protein MARPO_0043s0066 [Marchantia polymorpha]
MTTLSVRACTDFAVASSGSCSSLLVPKNGVGRHLYHHNFHSALRGRGVENRPWNLKKCFPVSLDTSLQQQKVTTLAVAGGRKEVQYPPADYDFRAEVAEDTSLVVGSSFPELMDLVENGTLVVVKRPKDYVERRSDGYREPEMVFVVGTAHMSVVSATEVERVVKAVRPENVVVELCRSRAGIMYDEPTIKGSDSVDGEEIRGTQKEKNLMSMSGENFGAAMSRSLRLGGRSALALRLLLGGLSEKLSKSAGVSTGEEFRAARRAAEEIGAQLVLGDRPIEVTLKRAWEALQWDERFRLAGIFVQAMNSSKLDASEEVLAALKSDDALSQMFSEMGTRLPSLLQPLIYERDMYLAWSLKRSKAVNGCSRVVGVVGKGHMRGTVYNLKHNQDNLRFSDLVGSRSQEDTASKTVKFFKSLLIETAVGGLIWLIYQNTIGKGT